ncbi:hypothetical protein SUGI_0386900 [Cryptomeria japonica]|nr:hypothetical protein SUGI_0386900 [Cryptomeria japonica]
MEDLSRLGAYLDWVQLLLMRLVLSVTFLVFTKFWVGGKSSKTQYKSLPPGSTGWPLIGETISFYRAMRSPLHPRQFIEDHEKRYGPIFRSNLFGRADTIVSVDPEFNRYVLQNEGRLFESSYPNSFKNIVGRNSLLVVHGDLQRKLHAIAANLLKHNSLISDFLDDT